MRRSAARPGESGTAYLRLVPKIPVHDFSYVTTQSHFSFELRRLHIKTQSAVYSMPTPGVSGYVRFSLFFDRCSLIWEFL